MRRCLVLGDPAGVVAVTVVVVGLGGRLGPGAVGVLFDGPGAEALAGVKLPDLPLPAGGLLVYQVVGVVTDLAIGQGRGAAEGIVDITGRAKAVGAVVGVAGGGALGRRGLPAFGQLVLPTLRRGPRNAPGGELVSLPATGGCAGGFDHRSRQQLQLLTDLVSNSRRGVNGAVPVHLGLRADQASPPRHPARRRAERMMPSPRRLGEGIMCSRLRAQAASTTASNSRGRWSSVSIVKTASISVLRRSGASGMTCA